MAWASRSVRLPDEGGLKERILAGGCGVSGDPTGTVLALWHGTVVIWFGPQEVGSFSYASAGSTEGPEHTVPLEVVVARPLPPDARAVAVLLARGAVSLLSCHVGRGSELARIADTGAVDLWPLGSEGLALVCEGGALWHVELGEPDPQPRPLCKAEVGLEENDAVTASAASRGSSRATRRRLEVASLHQVAWHSVPTGGDQAEHKVVVAVAGMAADASAVVQISQLVGTVIVDLAELPIEPLAPAATQVNPGRGTRGPAGRQSCQAVSLALLSSGDTLCALLAEGSVVVFSCLGEPRRWAEAARLSPARVSGLRMCAAAGLDLALLDEEDGSEAAEVASAPLLLQAWEDDTVSLMFPCASGAGMERPRSLEAVALTLPGLELAEEPYRPLDVGSGGCVLGVGSAGRRLVFAAQAGDGARSAIELLSRAGPAAAASGGAEGGRAHAMGLQCYRELLAVRSVPEFAERALSLELMAPRAGAGADGAALGCEQLRRLLEVAEARLSWVLEACGARDGGGCPALAAPAAAEGGADGWDDLDLGDDLQPAAPQPEAQEGGGGWGDMDLDEELPADLAAEVVEAATGPGHSRLSAARVQHLQALLSKAQLQLRRLDVYRRMQDTATAGTDRASLSWATLRDVGDDDASLVQLARRVAAEKCAPALEALFTAERGALMPRWEEVLAAVPETARAAELRRVLPAPPSCQASTVLRVAGGGASWYVARARQIVQRTGLCSLALDLLRHGIFVMVTGQWPQAADDGAVGLPCADAEAAGAPTGLPRLCGMFRLCAEYSMYCDASLGDLAIDPASEPAAIALERLLSFDSFVQLEPAARCALALRRSVAATVVEDVKAWVQQVSVEHCGLGPLIADDSSVLCGGLEATALAAVSGEQVEETVAKALLRLLSTNGWDPGTFAIVAEVVQGSSPDKPPTQRILKDELRLLEFIFNAVYSDDQRCHAMDIYNSVDAMFCCIPKSDANVATQDSQRWAELQLLADELEGHLNCVQLLHKHSIGLSLSFLDLRRGCSNEPMAIRSLWNLFRVLGARYRPALFWRDFFKDIAYLEKNAFAAVSSHAVCEMLARCLVEQEHFEVMTASTAEWLTQSSAERVAGSLVALAQELVNSSPSLKHASLEKARRILRCVPAGVDQQVSDCVQREMDFIKACEMLHDLVRLKPRHALLDLGRKGIASLAQVTSAVSAHAQQGFSAVRPAGAPARPQAGDVAAPGCGAALDGAGGASTGFRIDSPLQLRLQLQLPLRVVTDLLEFNPPVLLESEVLHTFCALLGLSPATPAWAEVMAMCGAANLLCGVKGEAFAVTEKLLANSHPSAWKLALALTSTETSGGAGADPDGGSDLLADAAKVCPPEELPQLLASFSPRPPPAEVRDASAEQAAPLQDGSPVEARGYAQEGGGATSLGCLVQRSLGLVQAESSEGLGWRGLPLAAPSSEWVDAGAQQRFGQALLAVDRDMGMALLDQHGRPLPRTSVKDLRAGRAASSFASPAPQAAAAAATAPSGSGGASGVRSAAFGSDDFDFDDLEKPGAGSTPAPASGGPERAEPDRGGFLDVLDRMASPAAPKQAAGIEPAGSAQGGFSSLLDRMAGGGAAAPESAPDVPAPGGFSNLFDRMSGSSAQAGRAEKPGGSGGGGFANLFDRIAGGAAPAPAPVDRGGLSDLLDRLASGPAQKDSKPDAATSAAGEGAEPPGGDWDDFDIGDLGEAPPAAAAHEADAPPGGAAAAAGPADGWDDLDVGDLGDQPSFADSQEAEPPHSREVPAVQARASAGDRR
ncbi:unnamed protein product [Prorocentrum cordatum]|uniref:Rab3 GTPase-activating protein catalytic subunit n=1 Tax=Prorocentrum cordatum TaxID=2364126 RepID=A0ABN9SI77_9DINO|nr:unnamed protein product [Polarella glacialis]